MKLLFKQRIFTWFDSYDIYNEAGETVYTVKGQLAWGHCLKIFNYQGYEVGTIQERIFTFLPKFEIYLGQNYMGCISKAFSLFSQEFDVDFNGWHVEGSFFGWDYDVLDSEGKLVATVSKELFNWSDTYSIDVKDPKDALCVLMLVIAIDAEKCSNDNNH